MNNNDKLFAQFPPVSTEEWEDAIVQDLKGADYDKKLVWKTNEHITVQPYYRAKDLNNVTHLSENGIFPYAKSNASDWKIRQDFAISNNCNFVDVGKLIVKAIKNGAEAVGLDFTDFTSVSNDILADLINDIRPEIEVNFMCNAENVIGIFNELLNYCDNNQIDINNHNYNFDFDPLASFILNGDSYLDGIDILRTMMIESKSYPNMHVGIINASLFGNCGAFIVDELAFGLSEFADILDFMTEAGINIDDITRKLKFQVSIGSNYFFEIAKIRAARYLIGQMIEAYKPSKIENCSLYIHAVTSSWNKTLYDPYLNMLRTTTESMSSIIGGIDSLTVLPFNFVTSTNDDFALRIARNQQIILKEESHFGKITDPAAGSYYIETLTEQLIEKAWNQFLMIIDKGGFVACFKENYIQNIISESSDMRDEAVATRKENFVGVNQYPNITENIDFESVNCCTDNNEKEDQDDVQSSCECENMVPQFRTLQPYRGPEHFERLRLKTELFTKKTGHRPKVFLFTYGNLAMRIARAGFASNFFGCAGFEIINNNGFNTVEVGIEAAKESKAEIVVICSSDEEYATVAIDIYNGLKDDSIVVVAGNPKESMDALKQAGLKYFIHVKTNILDSLNNFQRLIIK